MAAHGTEMETQWLLVRPVPAQGPPPKPVAVGPRHPGQRIGFLSNRKPNATVIGTEFMRLAEETGLARETYLYEKPEGPGVGASDELLDRIGQECDVAIVGSAD
jgi:hypothetical protein